MTTSPNPSTNKPFFSRDLSEEVLKISSEKPRHWEYKLFAQSLCDQISLSLSTFREIESNLDHSPTESIPFFKFMIWFNQKIDELKAITNKFMEVLNHDQLISAFGPTGQPGDIVSIILLTRKVAQLYVEEKNNYIKLQHMRIPVKSSTDSGHAVQ